MVHFSRALIGPLGGQKIAASERFDFSLIAVPGQFVVASVFGYGGGGGGGGGATNKGAAGGGGGGGAPGHTFVVLLPAYDEKKRPITYEIGAGRGGQGGNGGTSHGWGKDGADGGDSYLAELTGSQSSSFILRFGGGTKGAGGQTPVSPKPGLPGSAPASVGGQGGSSAKPNTALRDNIFAFGSSGGNGGDGGGVKDDRPFNGADGANSTLGLNKGERSETTQEGSGAGGGGGGHGKGGNGGVPARSDPGNGQPGHDGGGGGGGHSSLSGFNAGAGGNGGAGFIALTVLGVSSTAANEMDRSSNNGRDQPKRKKA